MATKTNLKAIEVDLPGRGGVVLPIAQVAPNNAAGTVQFKDGNTNLGGPRPVIGGFALGNLTFLDAGTHPITAVFTPANPAAFQPSTSNTQTVRFR